MAITSGRQLRTECLTVRRMTSSKTQFQLASRFGISKLPTGDLVIAPHDDEVIIVGCAETTAQAIGERIEILAEVAAGTVDGLTYDAPEVFKTPDFTTFQDVDHGHGGSICPLLAKTNTDLAQPAKTQLNTLIAFSVTPCRFPLASRSNRARDGHAAQKPIASLSEPSRPCSRTRDPAPSSAGRVWT
jgi:hypothetical protein